MVRNWLSFLEVTHNQTKVSKIEDIKKTKEKAILKRQRDREKLSNLIQNKYYNRYVEDENKIKANEEKIKELAILENNLLSKLQV